MSRPSIVIQASLPGSGSHSIDFFPFKEDEALHRQIDALAPAIHALDMDVTVKYLDPQASYEKTDIVIFPLTTAALDSGTIAQEVHIACGNPTPLRIGLVGGSFEALNWPRQASIANDNYSAIIPPVDALIVLGDERLVTLPSAVHDHIGHAHIHFAGYMPQNIFGITPPENQIRIAPAPVIVHGDNPDILAAIAEAWPRVEPKLLLRPWHFLLNDTPEDLSALARLNLAFEAGCDKVAAQRKAWAYVCMDVLLEKVKTQDVYNILSDAKLSISSAEPDRIEAVLAAANTPALFVPMNEKQRQRCTPLETMGAAATTGIKLTKAELAAVIGHTYDAGPAKKPVRFTTATEVAGLLRDLCHARLSRPRVA